MMIKSAINCEKGVEIVKTLNNNKNMTKFEKIALMDAQTLHGD